MNFVELVGEDDIYDTLSSSESDTELEPDQEKDNVDLTTEYQSFFHN